MKQLKSGVECPHHFFIWISLYYIWISPFDELGVKMAYYGNRLNYNFDKEREKKDEEQKNNKKITWGNCY